jgi:hypothetical protein
MLVWVIELLRLLPNVFAVTCTKRQKPGCTMKGLSRLCCQSLPCYDIRHCVLWGDWAGCAVSPCSAMTLGTVYCEGVKLAVLSVPALLWH